MPMKSKAQRSFMHAAASRGEIKQSVVDKFERATPKGAKLPARAKKKRAAVKKVLKGKR